MAHYFETKDLFNELTYGDLAILVQPLDGCNVKEGTEIVLGGSLESEDDKYIVIHTGTGEVFLCAPAMEEQYFKHFNAVWQKASFENVDGSDLERNSDFSYFVSAELLQGENSKLENRVKKELKESFHLTGKETHEELYNVFLKDYYLVQDIYYDRNWSNRRKITV